MPLGRACRVPAKAPNTRPKNAKTRSARGTHARPRRVLVASRATCLNRNVLEIYRRTSILVPCGDASLRPGDEPRVASVPCADIRHVLCYLPPLNSRISIQSILLQLHADAEMHHTVHTHARRDARPELGAQPIRPLLPFALLARSTTLSSVRCPPTPTPPQSPGPHRPEALLQ